MSLAWFSTNQQAIGSDHAPLCGFKLLDTPHWQTCTNVLSRLLITARRRTAQSPTSYNFVTVSENASPRSSPVDVMWRAVLQRAMEQTPISEVKSYFTRVAPYTVTR